MKGEVKQCFFFFLVVVVVVVVVVVRRSEELRDRERIEKLRKRLNEI